MGCRNARRRSEREKRGRAHGPTNTEVTWSPRSGLRYLNIVRGGIVNPPRSRVAGVRERVRICCSWRLLPLRWTHLSAIRPFRIRGGLPGPLHPTIRVRSEGEEDPLTTGGLPTHRDPCGRTPIRGDVFLHPRGPIEGPRGGCGGSGPRGTRPSLGPTPARWRRMPPTLTANRYLSIESRMERFSGEIEIPMAALDLLFWSRETGEIFK